MSVFDVPNIVNLQKSLITNLSGDNQAMNELALKVNTLNDAVSTSNATILPTLTKQNDVNAVLEREKTRLLERKQAIDVAGVGQQRLIDLTRNATQRSRAINNIYIVGVVGLLLYLAVRFASDLLPEMIVDILMILIVSITLLMMLKLYADLQRRNNMDFDSISLGEPSKMVGKTTSGSGSSSSSSDGAGLIESRIGGGCVKDACCPDGTSYNEKYAICVPKEVPFSQKKDKTGETSNAADWGYFMPDKVWKLKSTCDTTTDGYSFAELGCKAKETFTATRTSDMAKPNDPFEFADYNLYK